jgi:hypothetical protein
MAQNIVIYFVKSGLMVKTEDEMTSKSLNGQNGGYEGVSKFWYALFSYSFEKNA